MRQTLLPTLLCLSVAGGLFADDASPDTEPAAAITPEQMVFFETKVRPVLVEQCFKCHGDGKHKGNLQVDGRAHLLAGGDSGPAIVPGNPAESLLIQAINYDGYEMPPGQKMSAEKIADLTRWVEMGAPWPGSDGEQVTPVRKGGVITDEDRAWWAFQPINSPPVPTLPNGYQPENPIDAFVLATLEKNNLAPNSIAPPRTLIRRAFFDLIGLPPTPEEMDQWSLRLTSGEGIDQSAWATLIDDLLARPQYGERWARHWLDVVRFAQTNGYEFDKEKDYAWRYRDYVVQALNSDKPYDRFVLEQLAGDELPDADRDSRIATGFYRLGLWDFEPDDAKQAQYDDLDDIMVTSSAAFLGLTMGCARCHDHKFDPILHQDYYALLGYFQNIRRYNYPDSTPENPGLLPISDPEVIDRALAERQQRWADLDLRIAAMKELERVDTAHAEEHRKEREKLEKERGNANVGGLEWALAVREHGQWVEKSHVLIRGNSQTPGDEVSPAIPQVLGGGQPEIIPPERHPIFQTSGRRLALARWMVSPDQPLTARVMVNRVWHYHFGRGIVQTTSDFGKVGSPPSHPELLDWLANEFRSTGWSIKQLHRRIMTSQAYQRSSDHRNEMANQTDPGNALLWRQNLHRLEAEAIRDSILAVSGTLNPEMGGRGYFPAVGVEVLAGGTVPGVGWETSSTAQRHRRSLYTFIKRSLISPQLDAFDYANTSLPLTERPTTTVAPQALTLLNDSFMQDQAKAFSERIRREAGDDPAAQISRAFQLALNRRPDPQELQILQNFLITQQEAFAPLRSRVIFRPIVPATLDPGFYKLLSAEEFVDGPSDGWKPLRGIWVGDRTLDPRRGPVSLWNGATFEDAKFTSTLTLGNASELAGVFLRAVEAGNFVSGYEIVLDPLNSLISIVRHGTEPQTLKQIPATIPTEVPLHFAAEIHGNLISAHVELPESDVVIEAVDPQPLTTPGQLGVRTLGASVTLDHPTLTVGNSPLDIATAQVGPRTQPQPASAWTEFESDWVATPAGTIKPTVPNAGGKLIWNSVDFTDGVIEADVQINGGGDGGILARVTNPHPGIDAVTCYNINLTQTHLRLGKHQDNWEQLVFVPHELPADRWSHVRADFEGPRVRIFVDHAAVPLIDFTDPQPLPAGKIGLRTFQCPVEFRDVTVVTQNVTHKMDPATLPTGSLAEISVTGTKPDDSSQRALEALCLLILNLNEMIYVE
ncbi:DUF1553 domain-containing protein [Planctomicrobium sp. SH661]|uniref:DUF1553 domain-containing protein n=1 Tax=Planctomicrobium sp. SH661 TaxID=3448124 RepID=UPI003F5BDE9B